MEAQETTKKTKYPDAKIMKDDSKMTSLAGNSKKYGAVVSGNRKRSGGGGGDFGCRDGTGEKDQQFVGYGGLEDSELNGVSSLLQMQESGNLQGILDVIDRNEKTRDVMGSVEESRELGKGENGGSVDANVEWTDGGIGDVVEEEDGEEPEFGVGDFVWGKIKSHPWWPGRIYDPLDASDYAKKVEQGDKILVAYFGDGTFAWCNPSQLKPLGENFVDMSKQSRSKNFVNAVEKALDEVGRVVDMKMTCSCVAKENLIGFGRSLAVNAGVRDGLLVPESGIEKFSTSLFEPAECLYALKQIAEVGSATDMFKFTILKSWLSAFYRTKGGHQLPTYYEPQPVPGLEDDNRNWAVDFNGENGGVETRVQGPVEEDWLSSPRRPKLGQTTQDTLQKCQRISEDGQYQRRKQKSIAELIGVCQDEAETKDDDAYKVELTLSTLASLARKKRKDRGELEGEEIDAMGETGVDGVANVSAKSDIPLSVGKKSSSSVAVDVDGKTKAWNSAQQGADLSKPTSSSGRKKRRSSDEADVEGKRKMGAMAEVAMNPSNIAFSYGRKKRKGSVETDVEEKNKMQDVAENLCKPAAFAGTGRKKREDGNDANVDGSSSVQSDDDKAKHQVEKGSLYRERKKSRYLSPPYTILNKSQRKKDIEAESLRVSGEVQLGGRMNNAASHLIGAPSIGEGSGERSEKKISEDPGEGYEVPDDCDLPKPRNQNKVIDPMKVKVPVSEVLSQIRSLALDPLYLKESDSVDMVGGFCSAFRSSIFVDGSMYETHYRHQLGKKRKSKESEPVSLVKKQNQGDQTSSDNKSQQKKKMSEEAKSDKPDGKQDGSSSDKKKDGDESNKRAPAAALFVHFGPTSSLPSKKDLIKIYGKFGALDKQQTEMLDNNHCARIVFFSSTEAEEAFNSSQLASPFGAASVSFRLRYLSTDTKTRELKEIQTTKPSLPAKDGANHPAAAQSSGAGVSDLNYVKQKLEMMSSMLENSDGRMSPNMKSKLEYEMKDVLQKISTMVGSSS